MEINGTIGTHNEFMTALSAGTRAVSHYRNTNALDLFYWYEDGELRTQFEPLSPRGSAPDALVDIMSQVGFDLSGEGYEGHTEAAFALAERLTGVRVTEDLLTNAVYTAGVVEMPTQDWTSVNTDVTDTVGAPTYFEVPNPAHDKQD